MKHPVILDTGPLVASLNRRDQFHKWAALTMEKVQSPLFTCEPVIVEACFLLRNTYGGKESVMSLLQKGLIQIDFSLGAYIRDVSILVAQYDSVPMSLADACLVKMAGLNSDSSIMTIDSDFRIYRMNRNETIPLIMPGS